MSKNNIAPLQFPVCHCTPPVQRMWRDSQFRSLVRGGGVPTTGIYLFHLTESSPSCSIRDDGLYLWPTLPERPVLFWFNAAANNVIKVIDKRWCPVCSSQNVYAAAHLSHIYRNFLFCFCCFLRYSLAIPNQLFGGFHWAGMSSRMYSRSSMKRT